MPGKLAGTIGKKALAENSRAYYQNALDRHIYPIIGERKMQEITRAELEALLLGELNSGKAESTISAVYVTLRQMFESAEDSELIRSNPMQKVKKPRRNKADTKDSTQVEAFSIKEMQHILECLKNEPLKWQAYITLIVDTAAAVERSVGFAGSQSISRIKRSRLKTILSIRPPRRAARAYSRTRPKQMLPPV